MVDECLRESRCGRSDVYHVIRGGGWIALSSISRDHFDPAVLQRGAEPVPFEVVLRPFHEFGDVVYPDDFPLGWVWVVGRRHRGDEMV